MYSVLKSYGLNGLNGFAVAVEADVSGGLPAFSLVGLPDSAVRESGDRVRSAVKNLGYKWPDRHITVNLAPADIRKSGPVYDLPLLLAVLASSGQMEEPPADAAFLGELALDGSLRPVSGVLPMALAAAADGIRSLYVPAENAAEAIHGDDRAGNARTHVHVGHEIHGKKRGDETAHPQNKQRDPQAPEHDGQSEKLSLLFHSFHHTWPTACSRAAFLKRFSRGTFPGVLGQ